MLIKAFERLDDEDTLLVHSDRGWHYQMHHFQKTLKELRITQSISRKGNCYDNAVMENLFGKIKSEFIYTQEFERIKQFKQELDEYMRYYYNHRRIKEKLKGMSPVQYRTHAVEVA
ncbi:IS3 family transposase [Paenibacillus alvei]|uniref:IS3 family transposase n=1 Tax=Paenibacillus alvei TaxID=44250 RepID=A0AAP7DLW6_PAEAL|nr:IS3 family transposase [Paenibacillus alvei]